MPMRAKPKVLIIHNYYQIPGGEDSVVINEKKLLEENGHKVVLYNRHNSEIKKMNKFQKLFLPITTVFSIKAYNEVKKIIKKEKIDIVHVHNTLTLISPAVYYAAFTSNVPVVQTVHNFRLLCPAATFYREKDNGKGSICEECLTGGLKRALKYKCYKNSLVYTFASVLNLKVHRLLRTYKKINYICLTDFNRQKLLEYNEYNKPIFDPKKIFTKPNFVDLDSNKYLVKKKNQFVFVGRIDKLKGIKLLLQAWKNIECSDLIICGTGSEEKWCHKFITENKLNNVHMLGFIPQEKIKIIIAESKALILPTQWYEGFPMTIVESLSVGTPIIGSNIGNVGNIIENNGFGKTFIHDSIDSLRKVINKFDCEKEAVNMKVVNGMYGSNNNYLCINKIYEKILKVS